MNLKELYINKVFSIAVGDLVFHIQPNVLVVTKETEKGVEYVATDVRREELSILETFCAKAKTVISPIDDTEVLYSLNAGPQKVVILKHISGVYSLIINNQIQFTTNSEKIYHEALVSPAIACLDYLPQKFLILGGGDGLAAKQIYKENSNAEIVLVDFDKNITDIFKHDKLMIEINENAMNKCTIINEDAFDFVKDHTSEYDVIICDFPDPDNEIFNKLYTQEFYENVKLLLKPEGSLSVQSGSLVNQSKCFLCINKTLESVGFKTIKYYTPTSFGELVYSLCRMDKIPEVIFKNEYETLTQDFFDKAMTTFRPTHSNDSSNIEVNTLENFAALYYRKQEVNSGNREDKD